MTILNHLKSQLATARGRWPQVAEGSGVPVSTVRKIAQGVSKDPGVQTVQRLLDYFDQQGSKGGAPADVDPPLDRRTPPEPPHVMREHRHGQKEAA